MQPQISQMTQIKKMQYQINTDLFPSEMKNTNSLSVNIKKYWDLSVKSVSSVAKKKSLCK